MTPHQPKNDNPHARRMKEVFDFESRPGMALVRPEIAKRLSDAYKKGQAQQVAEMSTPPESDWTAEDIANQKRINAEVEREIEKWHMRMGLAVAAVGILLAVAIHFLGKQ